MDELNKVIKNLHKHKALGPDKIPNTALTEANAQTKKLYLDVFNDIAKTVLYPNNGSKAKSLDSIRAKAPEAGGLEPQATRTWKKRTKERKKEEEEEEDMHVIYLCLQEWMC